MSGTFPADPESVFTYGAPQMGQFGIRPQVFDSRGRCQID